MSTGIKHPWQDWSRALEEIHSGQVKAYPTSCWADGNTALEFFRIAQTPMLLAVDLGGSPIVGDLCPQSELRLSGYSARLCLADGHQMDVLKRFLPWLHPVPFGRSGLSMGLGDRLGLASPGHIRTVSNRGVRPVLAQQSRRELSLTDRTYRDVLNAASWACFQEGWRGGFGADGDHLKTDEDIQEALDLGFCMITLDCSEHIGTLRGDAGEAALGKAYDALPQELRSDLEAEYLGKLFHVEAAAFEFDLRKLQTIAVVYGKAIRHMIRIWETLMRERKGRVDFEISIDETSTPTDPAAHFLIARELERHGVHVTTLAPRFVGEFQKGIDYQGDLERFEDEFRVHASIADAFGYRLSIHSGSDKFSIFPIIAKHTKGRVHVKTAGTNWLESLRVICRRDAALFRRMASHSLARFGAARAFYHVTTNLANVPDPSSLKDPELVRWLDEPDPRQVLHITYGYLLRDEADGTRLFRDRFFHLLREFEADYASVLQSHIGRHIDGLMAR